MTILVVEDDPSAREVLVTSLRARNWAVRQAATGRHAIDVFRAAVPDVMILDLGLPDVDGIAVCRQVRRFSATTPIIVVTADGAEDRMIAALDEGADDYVVKPYSMPQLLARVRVALRHTGLLAGVATDERLVVGDVEVDLGGHVVTVGGTEVEFRHREFQLLVALMRSPGRVLTHRTLSIAVWGPDQPTRIDNLRGLVKMVRDRLGHGPLRPTVENAHGFGYRLLAPAASGA